MSKDFKAKKDAKDESTRIAFGNLRSKINELPHQVGEKEIILNTLANEMIEDRADFKKLYEAKDDKISKLEVEMSTLKEKFDEVSEKFEVEIAKCEMAEVERDRVQKNVNKLQDSKEQCFSIAVECCEKLRNMFASVGAFSSEEEFCLR